MPSETLHRMDAVSKLLLESWDGFTACYSSPPQAFCYAKQGGSEAPSKTLSSRDAAAKPPWMALRRVTPLLFKALVMPINEGVSVCPLKPYTAWMRCRSPHGWVHCVFQRAYTHVLSKRHKKSAPKCAFFGLCC